MNYKHKVSIIVPCYNIKPWLNECLRSLVDQTLQDIEIICVNDGSTDGTGEKLDEWQSQYFNKIKVIHQQNGGPSNARNTGMTIAQGECLGFVDSDDFIDATMYEKLYQELKNNEADIAQCNFCCFNTSNNKFNFIRSTSYQKAKIANLDDIDITTNISVCNRLFKVDFLTYNNLSFIDKIKSFEDLPFSLELLFKKPTITILDDTLYYYRKNHKSSLTYYSENYIFGIFDIFTLLTKKDTNQKFKTLILQFKLSYYATSLLMIRHKFKINFIQTASKDIFINHNVYDIYKIVITSKYRKFHRHILGLGFVIFLHLFYLIYS